MAPSVASITTAYNAARILPRQMDALLSQSRPLQEIIVVDNGSTDDTATMMAERYPQVTLLRLPSNVGAAGAWAAGLQYAALDKGYDWVWNFDDDSVPGKTALEAMLSGLECISNDRTIGMLTPLPVHQSTGDTYPPLLWREGLVRAPESQARESIWFADAAVASGCMVRREAVVAAGLPRADFFMDFFDFEYCLRLRVHGFRIAVLNDCPFAHELGDSRVIQFAGLRHVWSEHAPWREYYMSRNVTYVTLWLYPTSGTKRFLVAHLLRHAIAVLLFSRRRFKSLIKMTQGVNDGRLGRLGIRFVPGSAN